jgi:hypothetical protein
MTLMQTRMNYAKKTKGSITVETTLIISVVLFVLMTLVFSFMVMYQKAILAKTVSIVAQQGAEIWTDSRKQIENGYWDHMQEQDSIYYRLFDDSLLTSKKYSITANSFKQLEGLLSERNTGEGIQDKKFSKMKKLMVSELRKGILKPSKTTVDILFSNKLQRKIEVSLAQNIKIPLGFLGKLIGKNGSMDLTCKGVAFVVEPAENIRNIDLGMEYAKTIGEAIDIKSMMEKLKGSK